MKANLRKFTSCAGLLLGVTLPAAAGSLQPGDVVNDPVWVVHVDCDALKQSVIGQYVMGEMEKPEVQKKFAAFQAIFSFDPRKQLHGLTLYGPSKSQEDGVLLVSADFDPARLTTLAEGANGHESATHRSHVIHSWIDEKKPAQEGVKPRVYSAIHNGKVVIFAQKQSRVADALDVLDRAMPNLTSNAQYARLVAGEAGAFVVGAARKVELPSSNPSAAVLKQSKMVWFSMGEAQRRMQATVALDTDSEEIAKQIESIGRGLIGLMALQTEKPESVKLAEALSLQQDGTGVTIKLSLPAEDVVGMIKAKAAQ